MLSDTEVIQHIDLVLSVIQEKVNNPSPDDPFEPDIAAVSFNLCDYDLISRLKKYHLHQLLKNDKAKFVATAKEWTKKFGNCGNLLSRRLINRLS